VSPLGECSRLGHDVELFANEHPVVDSVPHNALLAPTSTGPELVAGSALLPRLKKRTKPVQLDLTFAARSPGGQ